MKTIVSLAWAGFMAAGLAVSAAEPIAPSGAAPLERGKLGRLELGTRVIHHELREESSGGSRQTTIGSDGQLHSEYVGTYIGSLHAIQEEQDYAPIDVYIQAFFNDYIGIGLSYDRFEAQTREIGGGTDGIVGIEGPILYLVGRYPNATRFVPFAEIGVAFYHADFDEDPQWEDGGPRKRRRMENEDTQALVLAAGCDMHLTENLSANLYLRVTEGADVDVEAWYNFDRTGPFATGSFPMDYVGIGVGMKYAF